MKMVQKFKSSKEDEGGFGLSAASPDGGESVSLVFSLNLEP